MTAMPQNLNLVEVQNLRLLTVGGGLTDHLNSMMNDFSSHFSFSQLLDIDDNSIGLPQFISVPEIGDITIPISLQVIIL